MTKIIDAKAVISAEDKTGKIFDQLAAKFKGVEKSAKALASVKPLGFGGDLFKEMERLKLTEKELNSVRKAHGDFERTLKSQPIRASNYFRAMDEWKGKTVNHWREVKASVDDTEKAHKRFFNHAGRFALHAAGLGGGAYMAGRAIHSTAEAYGKRGRALTRYDQMGLTDQETSEGMSIADAISSKFPSISRTEVLDYLRTNSARLGSWERSKEVAEPYAQALIANKLSGGNEHEMEQIVRALEGMGQANTPGQITAGLNAFARAKAANPDYTGSAFAKDLRAANAAKYGLSKEYIEEIFPILASHTSGFGTRLSTGLSALVGGRMTKTSKAFLEDAGIMQKGKLVDQEGYMANSFKWTQEHVRPVLEKQGVHFSEDMNEGDKRKIEGWASHAFSSRTVADLIITNLIDAPLVERARLRHTKSLQDMERLQKRDPMLAWQGVGNQLKDAVLSVAKLDPIIGALNETSFVLGRFTKFLGSGELPADSPRGRWMAQHRETGLLASAESLSEMRRRENMQAQAGEIDQRLTGGRLDDSTQRQLRLRRFDLQMGLAQSDNDRTMPAIYGPKELEQWEEIDREHRRGVAFSSFGKTGVPSIPLPRSRPADADRGTMPPVQSLEGATVQANVTGEIHGEVKGTFIVEASQYLTASIKTLERLISVAGTIGSGPGSAGRSSPDAAAPSPGFNGVP